MASIISNSFDSALTMEVEMIFLCTTSTYSEITCKKIVQKDSKCLSDSTILFFTPKLHFFEL